MENGLLLFTVGACSMALLMLGLHVLFFRERLRLRAYAGWITIIFALFMAKNALVPYCTETNHLQETLIIVDGLLSPLFGLLLNVFPMRSKIRLSRLLLLTCPYILFLVSYIVQPSDTILFAYYVYGIFFLIYISAKSILSFRRYESYIASTYSNHDGIDFSWCWKFIYSIIGLCVYCSVMYLIDDIRFAIAYYISFTAYWFYLVNMKKDLRDIEIPDSYDASDEEKVRDYPFAGKLEEIIIQQELYRNSDLSLHDLVKVVGSNRTYVSSYFSNVLNTTFYDYINTQRIERLSVPLLTQNPYIKVEELANLSGFNYVSTFRRAFAKVKNCTPREYRSKYTDYKA